MAVHERHLILVFEITHRAQPANEKLRADFASEVDEKPTELPHLDARVIVQRRSNQLDSFGDAEERLLRDVGGNRHHELVNELEAPQHEVFMPASNRVEAASVNRNAHE